MTSFADLIDPDDRERLLERLAELAEMRRLAEEPPEPPDPPSRQRAATIERTTKP